MKYRSCEFCGVETLHREFDPVAARQRAICPDCHKRHMAEFIDLVRYRIVCNNLLKGGSL